MLGSWYRDLGGEAWGSVCSRGVTPPEVNAGKILVGK